MPIAAELIRKEGDQPDTRRAPRTEIALRAGFRKSGYETSKADILDISSTGFRIDSSMALGAGSDVWLKLPGFEPKHARVVWVDGYKAGCEFVSPFYDAVFDNFLRENGLA